MTYEQKIHFTKGFVESFDTTQPMITIYMLRQLYSEDGQHDHGFIVLNQNGQIPASLQVLDQNQGNQDVTSKDKKHQYCKFKLEKLANFELEESPTREESRESNKYLSIRTMFKNIKAPL